MVRLGLLGISDDFDSTLRPALERLEGQASVAAVFDHVASRANHVAEQFGANAVDGVLAIAERIDVDGLLLLRSSWHGDALLAELIAREKPVYLADAVRRSIATLEAVQDQAADSQAEWMPGLPMRYQPVTMRLKELIATKLGDVVAIRIDSTAGYSDDSTELAGVIDWCSFVTTAAPGRVEAAQACAALEVDVTFKKLNRQSQVPCRIFVTTRLPGSEGAKPPAVEVKCKNGRVTVDSNTQLTWHAESHNETETLSSDRQAHAVMVDHFCRRIVGGLVPIPSVGDVARAKFAVKSIRTSLSETRAVVIER